MVLESNTFCVNIFIFVFFGVMVHVCMSNVLNRHEDILVESTGNVEESRIESVRSKRAATRGRIWDFGIVPYEIDMTAGFSIVSDIYNIKEAMRQIENFTCITFIERNATEHKDYIIFTERKCGCCAYVGKKSGPQTIGVKYCDQHSIIHELGHVIGFRHEHQRPDRDEYVEIKEENIGSDLAYIKTNYGKFSSDEVDTLDEPYDFGSIMHYPQIDGAILPKKGKNGIVPEISRLDRLSAVDIRKWNKLYKCTGCGRTFFDQEAAFKSPEYNNESTNRTYRCKWRIAIKKGERIRLKINAFDIFESSDCRSNYLEVRDGYMPGSPLLGRFCGNNRNLPKHIESTGNHMIINYVSTHTEHRGFDADYETFCTNDKCTDCNQMYLEERAAISSPEYRYKSTNQTHRCKWNIFTFPQNFIQLNITELDIFQSMDCQSDYLEVLEGDFYGGRSLGRFCGTNTPEVITSRIYIMTIIYVSTHTEHRGFAANYETFSIDLSEITKVILAKLKKLHFLNKTNDNM